MGFIYKRGCGPINSRRYNLHDKHVSQIAHGQLTFNLVSLFAFAKKWCLRCSPGLSDCFANYPR